MIVKKSLVPAGVIAVVGLWAGMLTLNVVLVLVLGLPFKWLWNALLPALFSAPPITYFQAAGLLGLVALLRTIILGVKVGADFRI